MYKKIIRLFLIVVVMTTAPVMGKKGNQSGGERSIVDRAGIASCICGMAHRLGVSIGRDGERTVTDTISYYTTPTFAEDYGDFMSGLQVTGDDSILTRFHLLTSGLINQFHVMTRNVDVNGNVTDGDAPVNVWVYGPAYQQDDDGDWHRQYPSSSLTQDGTMPSTLQLLIDFPLPSSFHNSDPDHHFNNQGQWDPWTDENTGWNVFNFPTWNFEGLGVNVNSDSIGVPDEMLYVYVGYNLVATDQSGSIVHNSATIWQDGTVDENDSWSCQSTLHGQGTVGSWYGIWNSVYPYHHLTQAVVQYEAIPPFVEQMPFFSDTWAEEKEVWADVVDLDGDAFACTLNVTIAPIGGNPYNQEIEMVEDSVVNGRYLANLSMDVGDTVNFYIRVTDTTGRSSTSNLRSFVRVSEPTVLQHVLVLQDGSRDTLGTGNWGSIYTSPNGLNPILGASRYYVWNVNDRNGVDYDVINHPNFDLIIKYGWGGSTMPSTGEDPYGFGDFLDKGGRLLYSDMDYFFSTGLSDVGMFSPGDFAYDYLGLEYYINDPDNDNITTNGGSGDLNHRGVNNDPVTDAWNNTVYGPLDYGQIGLGFDNWGDGMTVNLANHIFIGEEAGEQTGSRYNGLGRSAPFKTIYFAFPIEAAAAQGFKNLLTSSVHWLMGNPNGEPGGSIAQATPLDGATIELDWNDRLTFLFGGSVSDPDGDLIGYKIVLEGDLAGIDVPAVTAGAPASVSAGDVATMIGEHQSLTGTWKVVATDGLESIESGTRTLTVVTGALSSEEELLPKQFTLMGNYPNPFNPETKIRLEMPLRANVAINISDILGREVFRLGNQVYSQGTHSFSWDGKSFSGNNLPSGIYFYEVVATEVNSGNQLFRATDKMVLMK